MTAKPNYRRMREIEKTMKPTNNCAVVFIIAALVMGFCLFAFADESKLGKHLLLHCEKGKK